MTSLVVILTKFSSLFVCFIYGCRTVPSIRCRDHVKKLSYAQANSHSTLLIVMNTIILPSPLHKVEPDAQQETSIFPGPSTGLGFRPRTSSNCIVKCVLFLCSRGCIVYRDITDDNRMAFVELFSTLVIGKDFALTSAAVTTTTK
jgi:hypothetical protein